MPGAVSTVMDDRLWTGKQPVCNQPLWQTQPSTLSGTENEYTDQSTVTLYGWGVKASVFIPLVDARVGGR